MRGDTRGSPYAPERAPGRLSFRLHPRRRAGARHLRHGHVRRLRRRRCARGSERARGRRGVRNPRRPLVVAPLARARDVRDDQRKLPRVRGAARGRARNPDGRLQGDRLRRAGGEGRERRVPLHGGRAAGVPALSGFGRRAGRERRLPPRARRRAGRIRHALHRRLPHERPPPARDAGRRRVAAHRTRAGREEGRGVVCDGRTASRRRRVQPEHGRRVVVHRPPRLSRAGLLRRLRPGRRRADGNPRRAAGHGGWSGGRSVRPLHEGVGRGAPRTPLVGRADRAGGGARMGARLRAGARQDDG